jgi:hypothetical protein
MVQCQKVWAFLLLPLISQSQARYGCIIVGIEEVPTQEKPVHFEYIHGAL